MTEPSAERPFLTLAEKLRRLELTPSEQAVLETIFERAEHVDADVEGFSLRAPSGSMFEPLTNKRLLVAAGLDADEALSPYCQASSCYVQY